MVLRRIKQSEPVSVALYIMLSRSLPEERSLLYQPFIDAA